MFKGTKAERNKPKREQEIATRMKGMKKRIEAWKQVRLAWLVACSRRGGEADAILPSSD
jgi:hypothetical protein